MFEDLDQSQSSPRCTDNLKAKFSRSRTSKRWFTPRACKSSGNVERERKRGGMAVTPSPVLALALNRFPSCLHCSLN
eukprot:7004704-Pyramimonas_sp.AAC.1